MTVRPDPLQRIGQELVAAAARSNQRRLRRHRLLAVAVLPALLLTASAGAAAVGDLTTGLPAVDRLLGTEGQPDDGTDPLPGPGNASEPLRLPNSADGTGAGAVAYLSRDGRVCKAQGDFRRSDGAPRGTSGGGCYAPSDLARILSRRTAICCGSVHGPDRRIYDGFASGDVIALRFFTDDGATFEATLTPAWTPDAPGAKPIRLFVAIDERDLDVGTDGIVQPHELDSMKQGYRVEAELRDGRTVQIWTPWTGRGSGGAP